MTRWTIDRDCTDPFRTCAVGTPMGLKDFLIVFGFWAGTIFLILLLTACLA